MEYRTCIPAWEYPESGRCSPTGTQFKNVASIPFVYACIATGLCHKPPQIPDDHVSEMVVFQIRVSVRSCPVFIADDVVFTKNGANLQQPWKLMKMEDLLARYPEDYPLRVAMFRLKVQGSEVPVSR
jgi:hypothetical protein